MAAKNAWRFKTNRIFSPDCEKQSSVSLCVEKSTLIKQTRSRSFLRVTAFQNWAAWSTLKCHITVKYKKNSHSSAARQTELVSQSGLRRVLRWEKRPVYCVRRKSRLIMIFQPEPTRQTHLLITAVPWISSLLSVEEPVCFILTSRQALVPVPGADHILAQPSKRCSTSHIKPNETFELAKKRQNILCFGVCGRKNSSCCRQVTSKVPKTVKNLFDLQFCSWDGSFRHGEMKIWLCLYFQHVMRYIGTDFVEESRQQMQRSEEEHFCREGCFDRKEYISNTANKRCSRQVLQLRCSSRYSIKFYM